MVKGLVYPRSKGSSLGLKQSSVTSGMASRAWALPPPLMPKKAENDKRGATGRRIAHPPAEPAQR